MTPLIHGAVRRLPGRPADRRPAVAAAAPLPASDRDAALALAMAHGLPFVGLRQQKVEPSLFAYVPFELAAQLQVLPLQLLGDRLRLASADYPAAVERIQACFPRLQIELVIASREEIESLLAEVEALSALEAFERPRRVSP